jgi:hypothetical protein
MTSHLEESIITGTTEMSGSEAISLRKRSIAATPSIMPSSMLTSMIWAPGLDLLPGDRERGGIVAGLDQLAESRRPGDIRPLTDVDEQAVLGDRQRLQPDRRMPGRCAVCRVAESPRRRGDRGDVLGRRPAAAADQVDQAAAGELGDGGRGLGGRLVVLAEGVGQARIGIARDEGVGDARQLRDVGPHLAAPRAQLKPTASGRACRIECQNASVTWPERVRPEASVIVPEMMTGQRRPALLEERLEREDRGLGVEGVEDRLDGQDVGAAVDQALRLLPIGRDELVIADIAAPGSLTSGEMEAVLLVGPEGSDDIPRDVGSAVSASSTACPRELRGGDVEFAGESLHTVVGE